MIKKALATLVLCIHLIGCAGSQSSFDFPQGRPEAYVENASLEQVKADLTNSMLDNGYTVKSISDYLAVYEKRTDSIAAAVVYGSRYDSTPATRVSFSLANTGNAIRVVGNIAVITNPGSAFERVNDVSSGKSGASLQALLDRIRGSNGSTSVVAKVGKIGIVCDDSLRITSLVSGMPAEKAGIQSDDVIVEVDGIMPSSREDAISRITGEPGTPVNLKIQRGSDSRQFQVYRQ